MADKQTYTGLSKKQVTCEPYSMTSVEFFDTKPNYFRVSNHGTGRIYCGVSKLPSQSDYDFMCDGENIKMFSEPFRRPYLYILNPTGNTVLVDVLSFYAEFDPLALAFSEIKLDLSGTSFETTTAIDSFKTALPAGNNNIGKVTVSNWPSDYAKATNQKDYTANIESILSSVVSMVNNLTALNSFSTDRYMETKSGTATSTEVTYNMNDAYHIIELGFYSNDGESNQTITFVDMDGSQHGLTVKAGEVVNNLSGNWAALKVSGTGNYRMAYTLGVVTYV